MAAKKVWPSVSGTGRGGLERLSPMIQAGPAAFDRYDEAAVGRAIAAARDAGVIRSRSDVFVTTKMHPRDHGFESTRQRGVCCVY